MNSGKLKELIQDNNIEKISVTIVRMNQLVKTTAVSLEFVTRTRKDFLLSVTRNPKPRENKTRAMSSYLMSFGDTHTIYVHDLDKDEVYGITGDYMINSKELELNAERIK